MILKKQSTNFDCQCGFKVSKNFLLILGMFIGFSMSGTVSCIFSYLSKYNQTMNQ